MKLFISHPDKRNQRYHFLVALQLGQLYNDFSVCLSELSRLPITVSEKKN